MDDTNLEPLVPGDELAAVARALAELGAEPLPPAVATRLEARLAAELDASPLSVRRSRRRRLQLGASLSTAAAVAAAVVFALSWGGSGQPPVREGASALRTSVASATADSAATSPPVPSEKAFAQAGPAKKKCPATRTGGGPRPAACPGARGGHARAV